MAIKKDTLHPENEPEVDIYPKTSIGQVENLQANLDALNGDIANVNGEIANISTNVENIANKVGDINKDVSTLKYNDTNQDRRIQVLENTSGTTINRVEIAENNITDLQNYVNQNYVNQNVEDLYMILEQAQVVTVTTLEQAYTMRETADGENIVDGVQTAVKEIRGKTVATTNLIPYPYTETTKTANGVTFTVNSDGSITVNGTATSDADFMLLRGPIQGYSESYFLSGCPSGGSDTTYYISENFTASKDTGNGVLLNNLPSDQVWRIVIKSGTTVNNLVFRPMLNEGTEAKPYSKWFTGLKNASFEKIVSTGRNLIDLSGVSLEKTVNGVTFTKISDGQYRVTGTIADPSQEASSTVNINQGKVYPAGVYSIARYTVDGKDIEFFVSAYSAKTGARIENIDGANININEDFVIRSAGIYVNSAITGAIDLTVSTILNFGSSALPYESYISDTLSAETPIELPEYDVAHPETGETKRQSKTIVFDGTENAWENYGEHIFYGVQVKDSISSDREITYIGNHYEPSPQRGSVSILPNNHFLIRVDGIIGFRDDSISSVDEWKANLAALYAAGNPLTVTYKTAEVTTEQADFSADSYIAWKNGSETIDQGSTDNSEYGAENTIKQDYFTLTGGTTNV